VHRLLRPDVSHLPEVCATGFAHYSHLLGQTKALCVGKVGYLAPVLCLFAFVAPSLPPLQVDDWDREAATAEYRALAEQARAMQEAQEAEAAR
jgi:hypothetical protein